MKVRDHDPVVIDQFNGLWRRGREDSCPLDHFTDCENIQFEDREVRTRDGIDTLSGPPDVIRMYRFKSNTLGEGLISLDEDGDFYHSTYDPDVVTGPILSIPGATDFAMRDINGRAYISPIEGIHGMEDEFLYVYLGAGAAARQAAGNPPTNASDKPLVAFNSPVDGLVDINIHVIAVAFINGIGGRSAALGPQIFAVIFAPGAKEVIVENLPIGGVGITGREVYMTHAIDPKDWNPSALPTFYLAQTVSNNTATDTIISVADSGLTVAFAGGALSNPSDGGALQVDESSTVGGVDLGLHIIGVVYETDTGYLTAPGPEFYGVQTYVNGNKAIDVANIPVSPDAFVTKRHLISTKAVPDYNGDQEGFQFFFIPGGNIDDNTSTTKTVSYFDADLLDDASHLIDNFAEIPAGAFLNVYNGRLVTGNTFDDEGIVYLSAPGEPEAIDQVDGILIPPHPTNEVTNGFEFRDILYIFKKNRTYAYVDNGEVPSLWSEPTQVDNGIGAGFHSVATVLDSDGVNVEYLLVGHQGGLYLFTGTYIEPALSYKIDTYWTELSSLNKGTDFNLKTQIFVDSINARIYACRYDGMMFYADFARGLDAKNIRWDKQWRADFFISTIAMFDGPRLLMGSTGLLS